MANGFAGRLHSVFRRALNLVAAGPLITIADARLGELPNGLHVSLEPDFSFLGAALRPDMPIRGNGSRLEIAGSDLVIDLADATIFPAQRVVAGPLLPWGARLARLRAAQVAGARLASPQGLGPLWPHVEALVSAETLRLEPGPSDPLCRAAQPAVWALAGSLRGCDAQQARSAAEQLAGLGYGLTPSGDDLLTGFAGALALLGEHIPAGPSLAALVPAIVAAGRERTNIIAYTYLEAASRGEISSVLHRYLSALVTDAEPGIETATRNLFAVGGTSGMELALGALMGAWALVRSACSHAPASAVAAPLTSQPSPVLAPAGVGAAAWQ